MNTRTTARIGAAALAAASVAVAVPALANVSDSSPAYGVAIELVGGNVAAKGAVAEVDLRITCPANSYYTYLYGQLTQKSGSGVASGGVYDNVTCTNVPTIVTVTVPAQSGGKPFKAGTAYLSADFEVFVPGRGFVVLEIDNELKLGK